MTASQSSSFETLRFSPSSFRPYISDRPVSDPTFQVVQFQSSPFRARHELSRLNTIRTKLTVICKHCK